MHIDVSSADGGAACHGLVRYTLHWVDNFGDARTSSEHVPYKGLGGGGWSADLEVLDDTVLSAGACADNSPCTVVGGAVEKVSCSVDR